MRSNFYERLRDAKDYHRRFPAAETAGPEAAAEAAALAEAPHVPFTGEEGLGRCVVCFSCVYMLERQ